MNTQEPKPGPGKFAFKPMETIKAYLAGKQVGPKEHFIIRVAFTQLLILGWRSAFTALPELAIAKETPLMELPYLSDREKLSLAICILRYAEDSQGPYASLEGSHFYRESGKVFLRRRLSKYEMKNTGKTLLQEEVAITVAKIDQYVRSSLGGPYDFGTLRLCTLLYRPWLQWSAGEMALMREGGIKVNARQHEQRFFRPEF